MAAVEKMKIYVDMDGVLAVWNPDASLEEVFDDSPDAHYFLNRECDERAVDLVLDLKKSGQDVTILTHYPEKGNAKEDKKAWAKNHRLGELPMIPVPYGEDKAKYISGGRSILIDDFTTNLKIWEQASPNHVGIKFYNGINGTKGTYRGYSIDPGKMSVHQMSVIVKAVAEDLENTNIQEVRRRIDVPRESVRRISELLSKEPKSEEDCFGEDDSIVYTAVFDNGFEMDIKLCGVQFEEGACNLPWTEAVLFYNGRQVACTEPLDDFFGEWIIEYQGVRFVTEVRPE